MVHGKAPAALINSSAETIVTTGAVISSVPMVDSVDVDVIFEGDTISVDGDAGTIEIKNVKVVQVVSSAIIVDGKVLLLRRPKTAKSFPDTQSLVAGKIEKGEDPEEAAKREIFEETQINVSKPDVALPPVYVREGDTLWEVFPFLYRLEKADPVLNHENVDFEWVSPEDLKTKIPKTVPLTYKVVTEMLKK
jgi:8-oxo-dGTP pyrophosphatase MutT (NUDIX family)